VAPQDFPSKPPADLQAFFQRAAAEGRLKTARKTRPVDARPARPGEVVVTVIQGEGKETQSPPACAGDWVVRNRCPETGNEQYLVPAASFAAGYEPTGSPPDDDGWREFRPTGRDVRAVVLDGEAGSFSFTAPWGEPMVAHPGDVLVQDGDEPRRIYRVAAAAFACTYEVVG
jgi:hypothetical protein